MNKFSALTKANWNGSEKNGAYNKDLILWPEKGVSFFPVEWLKNRLAPAVKTRQKV